MDIEQRAGSAEWLDETAVRKGLGPFQFRIAAFLTGRWKKGLTYRDVFFLVYGLNKRRHDDKEAKRIAASATMGLYEKQNPLKSGHEKTGV